ncbi:MAG: general secretion pathway protein GspC [Myxococcales bacterium]|nr:general secretion pathway protein GspC [Myxococcales bacterium]
MTWMTWFERAWPLSKLLLVGTAAYLQAQGVASLVASEVAPDRVVPLPPTTSPTIPRDPPPSGAAILARNVFDSEVGPLDGSAVVPPPPEPEPVVAVNPADVPKCDFGYVRLIVAGDPSYAFASIEGKDRKSSLYRVGDVVASHRLHRIAWDRVWLGEPESRCQMRLSDEAPTPKPKRVTRPKRPRKRGRRTPRLPRNLADKITRISDTHYKVDRSALGAILEQQTRLMRRTRARPVKEDGEVVGLRLSRIRRGTLLDTVGLKNGDVIRSINGFNLGDPQKALEAYGRLRTANHLGVEIQRRGKPVTIDFDIQ